MFNTGVRKEIAGARDELSQRLRNLKALLSQSDLDASLKKELEAKAQLIREKLQTRIHQINGNS